jgi:hypothetical protein
VRYSSDRMSWGLPMVVPAGTSGSSRSTPTPIEDWLTLRQ